MCFFSAKKIMEGFSHLLSLYCKSYTHCVGNMLYYSRQRDEVHDSQNQFFPNTTHISQEFVALLQRWYPLALLMRKRKMRGKPRLWFTHSSSQSSSFFILGKQHYQCGYTNFWLVTVRIRRLCDTSYFTSFLHFLVVRLGHRQNMNYKDFNRPAEQPCLHFTLLQY